MKYTYIILLCLLLGCQKKEQKENLELEIITKELKSLNFESTEYNKKISANTIDEDGSTVVSYKLTNNTAKTYYFDLNPVIKTIDLKSIPIDRGFISIFDSNGNSPKVFRSSSLVGNRDSLDMIKFELLNYDTRYYNVRNTKNFIIHPHEILYFEWFLLLPYGTGLENNNYGIALENNKKYFATISIHSDSTYSKKTLSRTDLKTIKENGYEIFTGVVTSKNKIPIKFVEYSKTKSQ